jgi:hypothetical protein
MSTTSDALIDISRRLLLGEIDTSTASRLSFEVRERTSLRVTLITYQSGMRSARYGRHTINEPGISTVEYPECTQEEWRELHNQETPIERIRKILDSLTTL